MLLNGFCNDAARSEFTPSLVGHSGTPWSRLAHAVRTLVHLPVTAEVGDSSGRQLPTLAPRSEAGDSRLCHPRPSPARPDPVSCTGYALSGAQGLGGVTPQGILGETRLHISAAGAALRAQDRPAGPEWICREQEVGHRGVRRLSHGQHPPAVGRGGEADAAHSCPQKLPLRERHGA